MNHFDSYGVEYDDPPQALAMGFPPELPPTEADFLRARACNAPIPLDLGCLQEG